MKGKKNTKRFIRYGLYVLGMAALAFGLTLNTKVTLGVSPIISFPYAISQIWGINFGDMTFIWYGIFVALELMLHLRRGASDRKRQVILDLLQLPVSLLFTRFMNLLSAVIPVFETTYPQSFAGSVWGRIFFLLVAVVFTGLGAALALKMRVVPNPGDGLVQALSDFTKIKVGTVKNNFDLSCVALAVIISLVATQRIIGVGIGTLIAIIGVGRIVSVFNVFWGNQFEHFILEANKDNN